MVCENCGRESKRLVIHEKALWCGDCHNRPQIERSSYVQDDIPGGMVLENAGPEPVTVYSYTEMNQLFESRGLTRKEKFCPTPGTDKDPAGVQDSRKYMDPYTLEAATTLILRAQGVEQAETERIEKDRAWAERAFRPNEMVLTEREAQPYFDELAKRR